MVRGIQIGWVLVFCCVVLQTVITHLFRPRRVFNILAWLFLISLPVYCVLYLGRSNSSYPLGLFNGLLVYFLLYCNSVQCYYYLGRPVTLRLLVEFLEAHRGFLTLAEIQKNYGLKHMISSRLEALVLNGYATKEGIRYVLTRKGRVFAGIFLLIRRIFGVPYYLELK